MLLTTKESLLFTKTKHISIILLFKAIIESLFSLLKTDINVI